MEEGSQKEMQHSGEAEGVSPDDQKAETRRGCRNPMGAKEEGTSEGCRDH